MENNFGSPMSPGGSPAQAREAVSLPAILMMVMSALTFLYLLFSFVKSLSPTPPDAAEMERARQAFEQLGIGQYWSMIESSASASPVMSFLFHLPFFILNGLVFFGALKMKNLQSYGLAMTAAIISVIPCCGPCCCLAIPVGIWALVVLRKPEVRAAFT